MSEASRTWWNRENRPYDIHELRLDALVHIIGLVVAVIAGVYLVDATVQSAGRVDLFYIALHLGSLVALLAVSMAFNQWPPTPFKMHLARLDQASIFLFIAGSYTPFLAILTDTPSGQTMMACVWGAALTGVALKLIAPHRFGRIAILLYLGIGWSGLLVFRDLARHVPDSALVLLLAGGLAYTFGIIFHLWEKLRFQNALWHVAVVVGASLHLWAVLECMA